MSDSIQNLDKVFCHGATPDDELLVSDIGRRIFFFITEGWGTIGGVLGGMKCTRFFDFGKENITLSDVQSAIDTLEESANARTGFFSGISNDAKRKLLKKIAETLEKAES